MSAKKIYSKMMSYFALLCLSLTFGGVSSLVGNPVVDLRVNCPEYIYKIPNYTRKVYKKYTWTIYGDSRPVETEGLYFVRKIGKDKELVVAVCYRFGGSHYMNPRDSVPTSVQNKIKEACVIGPCHSGHLIPDNMGGSNEPKNFIPQFGSLNTGRWKSFENEIRNRDPRTTIVLITLDYSTNRPLVRAPSDSDIPLLYYQQPDVLNIIWFTDDSLYPDPILYYCASIPNNKNNKDGVAIGLLLSKIIINQPLGPGRYGRCN